MDHRALASFLARNFTGPELRRLALDVGGYDLAHELPGDVAPHVDVCDSFIRAVESRDQWALVLSFASRRVLAPLRAQLLQLAPAYREQLQQTNHELLPEIGTWRVVREIGFGAAATVYMAEGQAGARYAIKVIRPEHVTPNSEVSARMQREAHILQTLRATDCAHIVKLHDVRHDELGLWFVMDLYESSFEQYILQRQKLPTAECVRVGRAILTALHTAHGAGIVHRDVKPANVLSRGKDIALCDFGIAKRTRGADTKPLTKLHAQLGTDGYMSPEQHKGRDIDHRTDIFGAGLTLLALATGGPPDTTIHDLDTFHAATSHLPPKFRDVIRKAIRIRPEDRYQNAAEFRDALDDLDDRPLIVVPATPTAPVKTTAHVIITFVVPKRPSRTELTRSQRTSIKSGVESNEYTRLLQRYCTTTSEPLRAEIVHVISEAVQDDAASATSFSLPLIEGRQMEFARWLLERALQAGQLSPEDEARAHINLAQTYRHIDEPLPPALDAHLQRLLAGELSIPVKFGAAIVLGLTALADTLEVEALDEEPELADLPICALLERLRPS